MGRPKEEKRERMEVMVLPGTRMKIDKQVRKGVRAMCSRGKVTDFAFSPKRDALLYRMARHIRNTDKVEPVKWGLDAMDLLGELRAKDPKRYEREVK